MAAIYLLFSVPSFSFSPGVITTEIHKRGGMNEEEYQKVCWPLLKASLNEEMRELKHQLKRYQREVCLKPFSILPALTTKLCLLFNV